ncbi:MAG: DNA repair protein RecO [Elusimicrobia bacterium RIFOXYD12_FULL_66_9]|nr:MAG: DNA repair protein RecO [Elusimicrobia bacterium RIFOXYD12_FULL_66_9]
MILNAHGVVLSRRNLGEYDRLSLIFTEPFGKIPVRFGGVNRPAGKLKALSEPAVWAEYRLHLSPRSEFARCVGGSLVSTFPGVREDLPRTTAALYCCEFLERLTAEHAPSPEKYLLLCATLAALERSPSRWLSLAFGLRLMDLAGFSLRERPPAAAARVWEALHETEPAELAGLAFDRDAAAESRRLLESHYEVQTGRRLKTAEFRESLRAAPRPEGVTA